MPIEIIYSRENSKKLINIVLLTNNIDFGVARSKSAPPLNEVGIAKALPDYYVKYSQSENAKSDYFNRFSSKLSFEPSKPKGISLSKIKEAF